MLGLYHSEPACSDRRQRQRGRHPSTESSSGSNLGPACGETGTLAGELLALTQSHFIRDRSSVSRGTLFCPGSTGRVEWSLSPPSTQPLCTDGALRQLGVLPRRCSLFCGGLMPACLLSWRSGKHAIDGISGMFPNNLTETSNR